MDPELAAVATLLSDPADLAAPEKRRRLMREKLAGLAPSPLLDRVSVGEHGAPGFAGGPDVLLRVYRPKAAEEPLPVLLWFHDGAFIVGGVAYEDALAARLALEAECVVVAVEYRLAPEHPYPAAVHDGWAALLWTRAHADALGGDPERIGVGGTSAGGCLAAVTALRARRLGGPRLVHQFLITPVVDDRRETGSMRRFTDTPVFTGPAADIMWASYLPEGADDGSEDVAPARAEDLSGLPPAFVLTAELDPLRDEALAYGLRLLRAGVSTELHQVPGVYHAFDMAAPHSAVARRASGNYVAALRAGLRACPGGVPAS
ncbi:alpha/beta hydrolase [Streptomyces sp. NPDC053493]|uniref:alpha/beta hydrolase n=1 Tax=Streptomyces sp. NPDC053493 TaxID=3365705 RepID=UPI0037D05190